MDRKPKNPCKYCESTRHFSYRCYKNPKYNKDKPKIKNNGKYAKQWTITRKTWIRKNPPPIDNRYWKCYLRISPNCPVRLDLTALTLDHVISRSRDPSKRFNLDNLQPCCWWCNTLKGSRSIDQVRNNKLQ